MSDTRLRFRDRTSASELVALVRTAPIWDDQRRVIASIQIFRDVTSEYRSRRQLELLASASGALATAPNVPRAIEEIVRLPTAYVADWCFLDMLEDGALNRVAVACSDPRRV